MLKSNPNGKQRCAEICLRTDIALLEVFVSHMDIIAQITCDRHATLHTLRVNFASSPSLLTTRPSLADCFIGLETLAPNGMFVRTFSVLNVASSYFARFSEVCASPR